MKKNYSLTFLLLFVCVSFSYTQVLWEDDFESYEVGNFKDGNGWTREEGLDEWAQIEEVDSTQGKSLQLFAPIDNELGMFVTHMNNWASRTSGNDVFEASFDFYTGDEQLEGLGQIVVATSDFHEIVSVGLLSGDDKIFIYADGIDTSLVSGILPNTWYHIVLTYNSLTGEVIAQANGGEKIYGNGVAGLEPEIFDLTALLASKIGIDNVKVLANKTSTLHTVPVHSKPVSVSVSPNPASTEIRLISEKPIAASTILDLSGRSIINYSTENQLDISQLPSGCYVLKVILEDGTTEVQKLIKQ